VAGLVPPATRPRASHLRLAFLAHPSLVEGPYGPVGAACLRDHARRRPGCAAAQAPPPELDLLSEPDMLAALTAPRTPAAPPPAANGAIASWTSFDNPAFAEPPAPAPRDPDPGSIPYASAGAPADGARTEAPAGASFNDPSSVPTPVPPARASYDERSPPGASAFAAPASAASLPSSPSAAGVAYGAARGAAPADADRGPARRSLEGGSAWRAPDQAAAGRAPAPDRAPAGAPDPAHLQALPGPEGGQRDGDAEEGGNESSRLVLPGIVRCASLIQHVLLQGLRRERAAGVFKDSGSTPGGGSGSSGRAGPQVCSVGQDWMQQPL